jgi:hypothetical protein
MDAAGLICLLFLGAVVAYALGFLTCALLCRRDR